MKPEGHLECCRFQTGLMLQDSKISSEEPHVKDCDPGYLVRSPQPSPGAVYMNRPGQDMQMLQTLEPLTCLDHMNSASLSSALEPGNIPAKQVEGLPHDLTNTKEQAITRESDIPGLGGAVATDVCIQSQLGFGPYACAHRNIA